uniref:manganese-dependent ADP-ribose/CDP-alcohol diphosphatase-like n=1 Tax=Styela clava TaxID=7725 RepID=UPI00193A6644|nr:manganese-dependent ADP-ribose/CDP-alcohol diphosphatase-like [Styela clava]
MSSPIFSFGLIADVQYADIDDGMNYSKTRHRYYRKGLQCLQHAIKYWNTSEQTCFVLQLGDIIDGMCRNNGKSNEALNKIYECLIQYKKPIAHCWGNHELYNLGRNDLLKSVLLPRFSITNEPAKTSENSGEIIFYTSEKMCQDGLCCYHFTPCNGFRFIVLDCYDISALGRENSHPKKVTAMEILNKMNPKEEKNDHTSAVDPKYVKYNGGVHKDQLEWLESIIQHSQNHNEIVVLCGHIPIHPNATGGKICLVWNNQDILDIIHRYSCIVAYFAGHDHVGAYFCDEDGVYHCTFEAVLEAIPKSIGGNETAFATIDVYADKLEIRGEGDIKSQTLKYRNKQ